MIPLAEATSQPEKTVRTSSPGPISVTHVAPLEPCHVAGHVVSGSEPSAEPHGGGDPSLAALIRTWPSLDPAIRAALLRVAGIDTKGEAAT